MLKRTVLRSGRYKAGVWHLASHNTPDLFNGDQQTEAHWPPMDIEGYILLSKNLPPKWLGRLNYFSQYFTPFILKGGLDIPFLLVLVVGLGWQDGGAQCGPHTQALSSRSSQKHGLFLPALLLRCPPASQARTIPTTCVQNEKPGEADWTLTEARNSSNQPDGEQCTYVNSKQL